MTKERIDSVRRDVILGSKAKENIVLAWLISLGGASFLAIGLATYLGQPVLFFLSQAPLTFLPQGLVMGFYGVSALFLGFYLLIVISWGIGGGINEFDCKRGRISVFRWGFPGINRRIRIVCQLQEIEAVQIENRGGLWPSSLAYLKRRGKIPIPLGELARGGSSQEAEDKAAELAQFLGVPVETGLMR
nr:hypothetical chloroplast RF4 [Klebsormidium flaccidum]WKT06830.1 hypothetical chloroplast RF4 [Klebsormidium flaccidum]WKT07042.1 hypothetical chloroplast RF4 [Klebsormidium flaccidum]WKT07043.1 hypothetical chloroplast RF4 [Klebsormidium flaccidum]